MSAKSSAALDQIPRKMIAAEIETIRKPLADMPRLLGQAIERAIVLAKLSKQDVAFRMGYSDQSALSRWIAGAPGETPQFAKLFAIDELRQPLVVALAELAECQVETVIRTKRRA